MTSPVAILTPCFAPDLERLKFQRWALQRTNTDMNHLVVVHSEDLQQFMGETEPHPTMKILPTSQFLSRAEELARKHSRVPLSMKPRRMGLAGWLAQQVVKMRVAVDSQQAAILCLDADALPLRRLIPEDVLDGTLPRLFVTDDVTDESVGWYSDALRKLELRPDHRKPHQFIFQGTVLGPEVVRKLDRHVRRYSGLDVGTFLRRFLLTEYTTYGVYAERCASDAVAPSPPLPAVVAWVRSQLDEIMAGRVNLKDAAVFAVQSNLGVAPGMYQGLVQQVVEENSPTVS